MMMPATDLENPPKWLGGPFAWCLLAAVIAGLDYLSGPFITFPVMFLVPILGITLFCGRWWGFALGGILPGIRLVYSLTQWHGQWGLFESLVNFHIYVLVFLLVVALVDHIRQQKQEIQTLENILPICSFCRKIRAGDGSWHTLEDYLMKHGETQFSHGLCQICMEKHYGEILKKRNPTNG